MPGGRPSEYTELMAETIINYILDGKNLSQLSQLEGMPHRDTIHTWLSRNPEFADNYARACKIRREHKFETLEDMIDQEEDVNRARLKVDVIKWQLSKEEPKKYGDRLELQGETTVTHKLEAMSDDELNRAIKARKDRIIEAD